MTFRDTLQEQFQSVDYNYPIGLAQIEHRIHLTLCSTLSLQSLNNETRVGALATPVPESLRLKRSEI